MSGYYFIYTVYLSGRISIRDRPYSTFRSAQRAREYFSSKLAADPTVKAVRIGKQLGIDFADIDLKKII